MKPRWKTFLQSALKIIGWGAFWVVIGFLLLQLILAGYRVAWTGFGEYVSPTGEFVRAKAFWDWMELLIVPLVLAVGAFLFNRSEKANELREARRRAEEQIHVSRIIQAEIQGDAALQSYLDRMQELLLEKKLLTTKSKEVRDVARIRTLTVLHGLDPTRKGVVLRFLYEAGLIGKDKPIVDLSGGDLRSVDLSDANLRGVNLSKADMERANLQNSLLSGAILRYTQLGGADLRYSRLYGTKLPNADLSGVTIHFANCTNADFSGANLHYADLHWANLNNADLSGANLHKADLSDTNLSGANLSGAKVTDEQLATAKSLQGAIMPDGTKHD